ncbi:hypothetical protein [Halobacillus karajensis]|uniref:Uncharacterized protein n=1 Tax=Halobacillus karajensis TaxID=195088 RepID=A0A059NW68_9BACI|nr:hypothetical protein [Halobacillus karajensis]CDQ20891.1 hypothetical protein BN982_03246 [Halobacillus karajensis]CDQ23639.1 hypothetical protein BN983_01890 [Halobacillus karajensis]CDQ27117.1 hypothetical protein BN981_01371 [Halobacillus karajensis]
MKDLKGIDKRIYYQLLNEFPDKEVKRLTSINRSLYNEIRQRVNYLEINTAKYLQHLGFKYNRSNSSSSTRYDINALRRIKTQYGGNLTDIAQLLGVSRQRINQLANKKGSDYPPVWQTTQMSEEHISYCLYMINSKQYKFDNENTAVRLYKSPSNPEQFAVLIVEQQSGNTQCHFSLPIVIIDCLIKNEFVLLDAQDFEIKKACYALTSETMDKNNMMVISFENASELYLRINIRARKLGISLDAYLL